MKYTAEIEVRFNDLDAYGHVNSAIYFTYFEAGRVKLFKDLFINLMSKGVVFLIVKAECEYKNPIELSDKVFVDIDVKDIGKSSFTLTYSLHNAEKKIFAVGKTVVVSYDTNKKSAIKIPDEFLEPLKRD